jgi:hypothetical protein
MKNYYKALAGFQQECPVLLKDTDGYGYKYVDLTKIIHSINPLMEKHGLGFTQKLGTNKDTGQSCLTTTIFHVSSGESDSATVDIPLVEMKGQNLYQAFGSGTTYFRRYALSAQLGIISDKDVDAYGEQVTPTANKKLDLGVPKKTTPKKTPPTGDPIKDIPMIQKLVKAKKTWDQIEEWLRLTYDDLTIEQFKTGTNE